MVLGGMGAFLDYRAIIERSRSWLVCCDSTHLVSLVILRLKKRNKLPAPNRARAT